MWTADDVRRLLTAYYNRSDAEAEEVTTRWEEARRLPEAPDVSGWQLRHMIATADGEPQVTLALSKGDTDIDVSVQLTGNAVVVWCGGDAGGDIIARGEIGKPVPGV